MKRYIIACRFNHAFVCRAWVSKAKTRPGRRYGIVKNWSDLEAAAIAEVQQRAGGWPAQGFYPCSADLAGRAVYIMRGYPRTLVKRMIAGIEAHHAEIEAKRQCGELYEPQAGDVSIWALNYGRAYSYQVVKDVDTPEVFMRAENWRALKPAAQAAFIAHTGAAATHDMEIPCPPDLAARAIWPEDTQP